MSDVVIHVTEKFRERIVGDESPTQAFERLLQELDAARQSNETLRAQNLDFGTKLQQSHEFYMLERSRQGDIFKHERNALTREVSDLREKVRAAANAFQVLRELRVD